MAFRRPISIRCNMMQPESATTRIGRPNAASTAQSKNAHLRNEANSLLPPKIPSPEPQRKLECNRVQQDATRICNRADQAGPTPPAPLSSAQKWHIYETKPIRPPSESSSSPEARANLVRNRMQHDATRIYHRAIGTFTKRSQFALSTEDPSPAKPRRSRAAVAWKLIIKALGFDRQILKAPCGYPGISAQSHPMQRNAT